ncbi:MAG: hypothetical protein EXR98_08485 [Gemmataceae bacterium]|nr:hypothetical protein [Gemmataceae bacterium]
MPGTKILTKLDAAICLKAAWRAAQDLGFSLTPIADGAKSFTATKGSAVVALIAGAFAPQCVFQISVESYSDANELVLQKNKPWLSSGAVGVNKVNRQAEDLLSAIVRAIEKEGGAILERKEF